MQFILIDISEDYDKALKSTEFWRASHLEDVFNLDISDPRELEQKAKSEVSSFLRCGPY